MRRFIAMSQFIHENETAGKENTLRLDIYVHTDTQGNRFDKLEALMRQLLTKEVQVMALGDDILAKVREADGKVDSVIALINGLRGNTIPNDVADAILATISGTEAKLDAAIGPPVPPTP